MSKQESNHRAQASALALIVALAAGASWTCAASNGEPTATPPASTAPQRPQYEHEETRDLVDLVGDAADLVEAEGRAAFAKLAAPGSRWRHEDSYVFVLDPEGNMLVHPDPALTTTNQLALKDVAGRPIIEGLIEAATGAPGDPGGWYHYEWPVPGGLLPRWKSSYVELGTTPSGEQLIVGAGVYNDRMERPFVVHMVDEAVRLIEELGSEAFPLLYDSTGPFRVKDAYVFVMDPKGIELVNPVFRNLEGRDLSGMTDTRGKEMVREMLATAERQGSGWVDYMWPKPGDNVSTQKSTYVRKAELGDGWVLVASGVYLADAPKGAPDANALTAPELRGLVRDAAALLERRGEAAYAELREKGSKWFRDDTYFFVWTMDGARTFHAADPDLEGTSARDARDIHGRPYGEMMLDVVRSPAGEGWVHYMYPEPGNVFPTWKSSFVKRVTLPSGTDLLVGAGIYDMKMDEILVQDVVDRAAALVEARGEDAFATLRDSRGPFFFMDTYVFVTARDGTMLANPAQPSLEGKDVTDVRDVQGKAFVRAYLDVAMDRGAGWIEYWWYKPGHNDPTPKRTFVRKVQSGDETYVVGSGFYP